MGVSSNDFPSETRASEAGRTFMAKAQEMGFRVMPHFNFFGCDPSHSFYASVADYHMRELKTGRLMGWSWFGPGCRGNPQSRIRRSSVVRYTSVELLFECPSTEDIVVTATPRESILEAAV